MFSPGQRQLWHDLTAPPVPMGSHREILDGLFIVVQGRKVKNNRHKLKQERFSLETR